MNMGIWICTVKQTSGFQFGLTTVYFYFCLVLSRIKAQNKNMPNPPFAQILLVKQEWVNEFKRLFFNQADVSF